MPAIGPHRRRIAWLGWLLLLGLAWLAYRPGLSGGFLFDDYVNLDKLGSSGPIDDAAAFWRYLTSGTADPTGRPLALLSFLLDARDWPADPAPFLRTNLLLHLLNGSLLFLLLARLGRCLDGGDRARPNLAALLGAGLWLLHPLFVSTTLYVVQREAMLPATFMLAGLIAYVHGRERLATGAHAAGLAWMGAGIAGGTVLALLCKANGVLLPLLAWVLEATVLRSLAGRDDGAFRRFRILLLVLPGLLIGAYLLRSAASWDVQPSLRAWTIGERLLTQPRVLAEYLRLLVVPSSVSTGLFNDAFQVSRGLFSPATTLPAIGLVLALLATGFALRRRAPAWSAALLFFFAGHALESSSIPLELYFEHRNYVPALLAFWPLALVLVRAGPRAGLRAGVAIALLLLLAATTFQRSQLWGDPQALTRLWAARNPDSPRAQATAAIEEMRAGRAALARQRLAAHWQRQPAELQLALNYVNAACASGGISASDAQGVARALAAARGGTALVRQWLEKALQQAVDARCPGMTLATVEAWAEAAHGNPALFPSVAKARSDPTMRGLIELQRGDAEAALVHFNTALAANPRPEVAAAQAVEFAARGHYRLALRHLDELDRLPPPPALKITAGMPYLHERVLQAQDYWPTELRILRQRLEAELSATPAATATPP